MNFTLLVVIFTSFFFAFVSMSQKKSLSICCTSTDNEYTHVFYEFSSNCLYFQNLISYWSIKKKTEKRKRAKKTNTKFPHIYNVKYTNTLKCVYIWNKIWQRIKYEYIYKISYEHRYRKVKSHGIWNAWKLAQESGV